MRIRLAISIGVVFATGVLFSCAAKGVPIETDSQATQFVDAYVEAYVDTEGAVVVDWFLSEWAEDLSGFELSRAEAGAAEVDEELVWSVVGEALIRPDFDMARLRRLELDQVIEQRPALNQEHIASPDAMIAGFIESAEEFQKLHLIARGEPQWAVAFGLGWIDRNVEIGATYVYRVHRMVRGADGSVERGELVGEVDVNVLRNAVPMPPLETWSVEWHRQQGWVTLTWTIRADVLAEYEEVRGFNILFGHPDAPLEDVLTWTMNRGAESEDGHLISFTLSREVETDEAVKFALQPTGRGDATGPLSPRIVLPELGGDMGSVTNLEVSFEDSSAVLRWDYDVPGVGAFDGFRVTRMVRVDGEPVWTVLTEELLPSSGRTYIDAGVLDVLGGEDVTYSVRAISGDSREDSQSGRAAVTIPGAQPAAPSALRVVPAIREGEAYVDIEVDYESDIPADRFVVYRYDADNRRWHRFASFSAEDGGTSIEMRRAFPGRSFPGESTFRAVATREHAPESEPSGEVNARLPAVNGPGMASRMRVAEFSDRVEFQWWARSSEFVAGARIMADGEVIANETVLGRGVRRWTWRVPPDGSRPEYTIVLVDEFGREGDTERGLMTTARFVPEDDPAADNADGARPEIVRTTTRRVYHDDAETQIRSETQYAIAADGTRFKHGTTTYFDEEGRIVRQAMIAYDEAHGPSRLFNPDGSIRRIVCKLNGEVVTLDQMNEALGDDWITEADRRWFENNE